jgi:hypothetical protein
MRRRLPGHLASLAALLRSMPTAHGQGYQALARLEADKLIQIGSGVQLQGPSSPLQSNPEAFLDRTTVECHILTKLDWTFPVGAGSRETGALRI